MTDEITQLKNNRIGTDACCKTCKHAYPIKVSLLQSVLSCREGPPSVPFLVLVDQQQNIANVKQSNHTLINFVPDDYFCGRWQPEKIKLS